MDEKDLYFLLYLAQKIGLQGAGEMTTRKIAEELAVSQQTASRKLHEFAEEELIVRQVTPKGITVRLTQKGREKLQALYGALSGIFDADRQKVPLAGTVKEGLGEGRFYMSQEGYTKQFQEILQFVPYAGTLNLAVDKNAAEMFLGGKQQYSIQGFTTKERTFGALLCYKIQIITKNKNINGAVIVPERSVHSFNTHEIIAPMYLRDVLKLKNGSEVHIV